MSGYPREDLAKTPESEIDAALGRLSWRLIEDRIKQLDHCATGGVSLNATLIAALVVRLVEVHPGARPKIPHGNMSVAKARKRWDDLRQAAAAGDPAAMIDAVQNFEGIADLMLNLWEGR